MILDKIGHGSGLGWAAGVYCCKSPLNGKDQNKFSNSLTFARMSKRRQNRVINTIKPTTGSSSLFSDNSNYSSPPLTN